MLKKRCKECGGEVIVARSSSNKELPLDTRVVVYRISKSGDAYHMPKEEFMISHFVVCKGGVEEKFNPGGTD